MLQGWLQKYPEYIDPGLSGEGDHVQLAAVREETVESTGEERILDLGHSERRREEEGLKHGVEGVNTVGEGWQVDIGQLDEGSDKEKGIDKEEAAEERCMDEVANDGDIQPCVQMGVKQVSSMSTSQDHWFCKLVKF